MTLTIHNKRPTKGMFQAIKDKTRNDIIEECIQVIETFPKDFWGYTQDEVIAAIRALKDKP